MVVGLTTANFKFLLQWTMGDNRKMFNAYADLKLREGSGKQTLKTKPTTKSINIEVLRTFSCYDNIHLSLEPPVKQN
jgi:hypothetical protein